MQLLLLRVPAVSRVEVRSDDLLVVEVDMVGHQLGRVVQHLHPLTVLRHYPLASLAGVANRGNQLARFLDSARLP